MAGFRPGSVMTIIPKPPAELAGEGVSDPMYSRLPEEAAADPSLPVPATTSS